MITVELVDDKKVSVVSDMPFRDNDLIRQVPGSRHNSKTQLWTIPKTWASYQTIYAIFGIDNVTLGEKFHAWAVEEYEERIKPSMELRSAWDAPGDPALYPFQRAGVQFLKTAQRALLCDEPGSGKTIQAIRTLYSLWNDDQKYPFPALVVAPSNMTLTWKKEFDRWFPGLVVTVIRGTATQRRKALDTPSHVYVINYENLKSHSRLAHYGSIKLKTCIECDSSVTDPKATRAKCHVCKKELNEIPWRSIIVDEAHKLKNPQTQQTRACWALAGPDTEYIYGLTGTPIASKPNDLWGALHMLAPEEHPSHTKFLERYCLTELDIWGALQIKGLQPSTSAEFFALVDPRMRRMPKEAVLPFLPPKLYSTRYVDMSAKQAKAYNQMADGMMAQVEGGTVVATDQLSVTTRLTQFSSAYGELNAADSIILATPSNKIDTMLEILDELAGAPAVVFAQSKQLIDLAAAALEKAKISYSMIVGGQNDEQREMNKEKFQNGQVRVVLCTIAAGGIGITLNRANTAIFLQRSWSMIDNLQAEDRVHRIGSEVHDHVQIIDIVSNGTLEVAQRRALERKGDMLQEIVRDKESLNRLLHGEEF